MYYRYDITRDYYDCETCLWNGVCDQVTIELPAAAYFPSESGVRRSRVHITLDGCRYGFIESIAGRQLPHLHKQHAVS